MPVESHFYSERKYRSTMFSLKFLGLLVIFSVAASEMITFKPFVKSRYSLRARGRTTTKIPLTKGNETTANNYPGGSVQYISSQYPSQYLPSTTVMPSVGKNWQETNTINSDLHTTAKPELLDKKIETTPGSELIKVVTDATTQSAPTMTTVANVKTETPTMTSQTEWVYDYYASDDENPKRRN